MISIYGIQPFPNAHFDLFGEELLEAKKEELKVFWLELATCSEEIITTKEFEALLTKEETLMADFVVLMENLMELAALTEELKAPMELAAQREEPTALKKKLSELRVEFKAPVDLATLREERAALRKKLCALRVEFKDPVDLTTLREEPTALRKKLSALRVDFKAPVDLVEFKAFA